jgi:hypothetical protein
MNPTPTRIHPLTSLLLALMLVISSLAASPKPESPSIPVQSMMASDSPGIHRFIAPADGPDFPNCTPNPDPFPVKCANLQVFLLIDDSFSMRSSDPARQRLEGVKNVLDILAKEYYLPAVDVHAKDPNILLPNIQVSLIHFSSEKQVLHNSGWKTIAPQSIDEWTTQLKAFDADLVFKPEQEETTDFHIAFNEAAELAKAKLQDSSCRLVMLFTDGMPDQGYGSLAGAKLTKYMNELQDIIRPTFNRSNDFLFVSLFGLQSAFSNPYKQKWEEITKDSADLDPRRVQYVKTQELAARMERIIGWTIGDQVYTLSPITGNPQKYVTEIPMTVESLRLTYYTIKTATNFTVTGPDGKIIEPDDKNIIFTGTKTSIQVLEILNPAPGSYQINTTAAGGLLTRLLRFEKITAKLSLPGNNLLQFTNGQIGIQLLGADGKPLDISPGMSIQAALTLPENQPTYLPLTSESDTLITNWMPLTTDQATVYACATLKDNQGKTIILYHGEAGKINIDPVVVQIQEARNACVPTEKDVSVPLQLINGSSQQPATIDAPVKWTSSVTPSSGGTQLTSTISEVDAKTGKYVLHFKPTSAGDAQLAVMASATVDGVDYPIKNSGNSTVTIQPPRQLKLTLGAPKTLDDRLSVLLYRSFHPCCIDDNTEIIIGRHLFGWFGPIQAQINGRFNDTSNNVSEPGIERFYVQLVSAEGGPPSERLNSWTAPETGDGFSTLEFRSPGLGLYNISITDQGKNLECTELASLPTTRTVLLINDFWEYLIVLILILILALLVLYLLRRYRNRRYSHEIPLILFAIVLISLNIILVNLLGTQAFKCQFNCNFLIDHSLCNDGFGIPPDNFEVIPQIPTHKVTLNLLVWKPEFEKGAIFKGWTISKNTIPLLPPLAETIDPPLETLRKFISWTIVLFFALASLILTYITSKIRGFIDRLQTTAGRSAILTRLSIWLLFFVIFSILFYSRAVP